MNELLDLITKHADLVGWLMLHLILLVIGSAGVYWMKRLHTTYEDNEFLQYAVDYAYNAVRRRARKGDDTFKKVEHGLEVLRTLYAEVDRQITPEMEAKAKAEWAARHEDRKQAETDREFLKLEIPAGVEGGGSGN